MSSYLAFLFAATVLAITPGPGIAFVVARTVSGGRAEGLAACFGTGIGGLLHVLAAAFGLSVLLAQSALAFSIVKYLGATYLIYLGVRLILTREPKQLPVVAGGAHGVLRALRDGMVVEALNVKTAVFFVAFLPQFVTHGQPLVPQLMLLGGVCVGLNTLADVAYVLGTERLLGSSSVRAARERILTKVSGCTMVGLGLYLASAKREV